MQPAYKQVHQPPTPAPPLRVVPGGGFEMFACPNQPGNLRLTINGCVTMFKRAQEADIEYDLQLLPCRECSIGSKHANTKSKPPDPVTCARCEERTFRLVGKILCISCLNRQYEFVSGRNARGDTPKNFKPLCIYDHDDSLIIVARDPDEAGRVAERIHGYFDPDALINYGQATPSEINKWWNDVKKWSAKNRKPRAQARKFL